MIISAAVKVEINDKEVVIPCLRHGHAFQMLKDMGLKPHEDYQEKAQGFIDHLGIFMDRKEAFRNALQTGQLSSSTIWYKLDRHQGELYSEDLY